MSRYKVNDIRVRLYGIVNDIFTDSYNMRYMAAAKMFSHSPDEILFQYNEATDQFIVKLCDCLHDAPAISRLVSSHSNEILYCFFLRYHFITQNLINKNQDEPVILPDDDVEFFKSIFLFFWRDLLSK